jgi:hypothetical protein
MYPKLSVVFNIDLSIQFMAHHYFMESEKWKLYFFSKMYSNKNQQERDAEH